MRLKCQVEVVNRCVASHGLQGGRGKFAQSSLFLTRKPGDVIFLIHCTARDKQGVKYKLRKNIAQIFGKFVSEGKATIRLCEPSVDLCIKMANPVELKHLLSFMKLAHEGQSLSGKRVLSSMTPATSKHVEKPKTKLVISSRKNYPITSSFPSLLETLQVQNCQLIKIDSRIMSLKHLTHLDLSSNKIQAIPVELSEMSALGVLNMSYNELTEIPADICAKSSNLCKTLCSLNLSNNRLTQLPATLHRLEQLWQVCLNNNSLAKLPQNIGDLRKLRKLSVANNSLTLLPLTFSNLRLETLDLFGNNFRMILHPPFKDYINSVLSLREICGRAIREQSIFYDNDEIVPYPLIKYLDSGKQCCCKKFCFDSFIYFQHMVDLRKHCENLVCLDTSGQTSAPLEALLCSRKCSASWPIC